MVFGAKTNPSVFAYQKLKNLVEQVGESWDTISSCFPDRNDVQCQQRWHKVVNPELVKGPWTKEVSRNLGSHF